MTRWKACHWSDVPGATQSKRVVPLAFVNYEPALFLLGRPDPLGLPAFVRLLSPFAALIMALLARYAWRQGVLHYQSTGS